MGSLWSVERGSADPADPLDLESSYAPPRRDWVRASFITSVDGAVTVGGVSRGLQVPADVELLAVLRGYADVVLVGAGTARAEGYRPARMSGARRERRLAAGQLAVPPIAVVTGQGDPQLPDDFYTGEVAPLVCTTEEAALDLPGAEVVICGATAVDPARLLAELRNRGLGGVLCEGGPRLLATLAGPGLLDELCLTVAPVLAGPGPGRLSGGTPWLQPVGLNLVSALAADGALFLRYRAQPGRQSRG